MKYLGLYFVFLLAGGLLAADAPKPATTQSTTKPAAPKDPLAKITDKDVNEITYEDAEVDTGFVGPIALDLDNLADDSKKRLDEWTAKLNDWAGAKDENTPQRVQNLLSVAGMADLGRGEFEGETAYVIFEKLKSEVDKDVLVKVCAWMVLKPEEGKVPLAIKDLGWEDEMEEAMVRERASHYAKKLLGRLLGKLPPKNQ